MRHPSTAEELQIEVPVAAEGQRPGGPVARLARGLAVVLVAALTVVLSAVAVSVFAWHLGLRPVLSPSMIPTYGPGWAIVTKPVAVGDVRPGDIIVFTPPGSNVSYAHRVETVTNSASGPVITTKGDANRTVDPWHVRLNGASVPEVVAEVPYLGQLMVDFHHLGAGVILTALFGVALAVGGARAILRGTRPVPAEQPELLVQPQPIGVAH